MSPSSPPSPSPPSPSPPSSPPSARVLRTPPRRRTPSRRPARGPGGLFGSWTRRTETLVLTVAGAVALVGYVLFLDAQERRAARYMAELAATDPARYLLQLKKVRGFEAYLAEYRRLFAYEGWRVEVPEFLLGRWMVSDREMRVADGFEGECLAPLVIESGRLTLPGAAQARHPVQYRIVGDRVEARLPRDARVGMRLVASGIHLHHLELDLPGRDGPLYAYRCR